MICVLWMPLRMPWVRTPETYWRVRIEWLRVSPSVPRERDNHCENYAVSPIEHQIHCANAVVETHTRNRQRTDMHAHVKRRVPAVKIVHMRRSCAYSLVHGNPGHQPKIEKLIFDTVATMYSFSVFIARSYNLLLFVYCRWDFWVWFFCVVPFTHRQSMRVAVTGGVCAALLHAIRSLAANPAIKANPKYGKSGNKLI